MDMKQLRYFVTIVDSGSLSRAAKVLYIAQPALSQQMAKLEAEIGKPLLVRSIKGVEPTSNGYALYHQAKFMLRQFDHALTLARQDHADITGKLTLGLAPTTICALGQPLLSRMHAKYPGVVLNIIEGLSGHLQHMAASNQLDMVVLFSAQAVPDWRCTPLLEEELFLILPRHSPLVPESASSISLQEISELPLILPSQGHGLRTRIELEFAHRGIPFVPAAEIDSLPLLMSCLSHGMGATIKPMSAILVNGPGQAYQWRCLRIADAAISRTNYLYRQPAVNAQRLLEITHAEILTLVQQLAIQDAWQGIELIGAPASVVLPEPTPACID